MAALDKIHNAVKNALVKDGWTITDDPLTIEYKDAVLYADLGAEKVFAAEKGGKKIAVEVKSFSKPSHFYDLENAFGQYYLYNLS